MGPLVCTALNASTFNNIQRILSWNGSETEVIVTVLKPMNIRGLFYHHYTKPPLVMYPEDTIFFMVFLRPFN